METSAPQQLLEKALAHLPYTPEPDQLTLLKILTEFVVHHGPRDVLILNGYAGTGKTSLVGAVISAMAEAGMASVILAPTGRAAKVASGFSGKSASTIHRRIYRPLSAEPGGNAYFLAANSSKDTIFFIDEASMIADRPGPDSILLHLARYVYSTPGCAMVLIGDTAQLPPVGQTDSPAMKPKRLKAIGLTPYGVSLEKPMRQSGNSGILFNATQLRRALFAANPPKQPPLTASRFPDVETVNPLYLADMLSTSWGEVGQEETVIITRSNKRANRFNQEIRQRVLFAEEPLQPGERLVIAKNDYFWPDRNRAKGFIANGETCVVSWIGTPEKKYGRWFVDVEIEVSGFDEVLGAKLMLRSLMSEGPTISREEQERFFNIVCAAYDGEISEKMKAVDRDPYYNALQAKYAYCVTCHKAQGGQWSHVYVDLSTIMPEAIGPEFYRWLYTAVTRATKRLFLINPSFPVR